MASLLDGGRVNDAVFDLGSIDVIFGKSVALERLGVYKAFHHRLMGWISQCERCSSFFSAFISDAFEKDIIGSSWCCSLSDGLFQI